MTAVGTPQPHPVRVRPSETGASVLLVADDADPVHDASPALDAAGFAVVVAGDAGTAVSMSARVQPDVVVLDIELGDGAGVITLLHLRALPATSFTPVIVLTGGGSLDRMIELSSGGLAAILEKPVEPDVLLAAVEAAVTHGF